jgi:D-xylose 1-dehydrogenase (NADP+, D-xylono-1,5-lactone-forming)
MSAPLPALRIGVLGAANIARTFISAIKGSTLVTVAAVASRDLAKAQAFAAETGVPRAHGSYEAMLTDPEIDAIYNPLPNALHAQWTIAAANAGKHVLCEKPFAVTSDEARAMFAAADKNNVKVVEAYPYLAQPHIIAAKKMMRENALGKLQTLYAAFGFTLTRGPDDVRWSPELAGGALLDGGSYPVSFTRVMAGERPTHVHAMANFTERNVDRALVGTLIFASGLQAQIACSFGTARHRRAVISGTEGLLECSFLNEAANETQTITHSKGAATQTVETLRFPGVSGFREQTHAFARLIRTGWSAWPGATPQESIDIAMMLEALAKSAREGRTIRLP